MDTRISRSFQLVGLAIAAILLGSVLYVSFDVISYNPCLRPVFLAGLYAEIIATLAVLPLLILEDVVKAKKLTLPKFVRFRISRGLWGFSLILAILGAAFPYIHQEDLFLTSMVFVAYPATLLALVCLYGLISSLVLRQTDKG